MRANAAVIGLYLFVIDLMWELMNQSIEGAYVIYVIKLSTWQGYRRYVDVVVVE